MSIDDRKPAGAPLPPPVPPPRKAAPAPAHAVEDDDVELDIDDRENVPTAKASKHSGMPAVGAPAHDDDPFADAASTTVDGSGVPGAARFEDEIPTKVGADRLPMADLVARGAVTAADRTTFDPLPRFPTAPAEPASPPAHRARAPVDPDDLFPEPSVLPDADRTGIDALPESPADDAVDLSHLSGHRGAPHLPLGHAADSTGVDALPAGAVAHVPVAGSLPTSTTETMQRPGSGGGQRVATLVGGLARRRFTLSGASLGLLMAGSGILGGLLARRAPPEPTRVAPVAPAPRAVTAPVVQPIEEAPAPPPPAPTITPEPAPPSTPPEPVTAAPLDAEPKPAAAAAPARPKPAAKPVRRRVAPARKKTRR